MSIQFFLTPIGAVVTLAFIAIAYGIAIEARHAIAFIRDERANRS